MHKSPLNLNGSIPTKKETAAFAGALSDAGILTAAGGYLFKSRFDGSTLHIGIAPTVSEGQRLHHYDITVPEGEYLLGSISATGEFTLLFKAETRDSSGITTLNETVRSIWRKQYTAFAETLFFIGYSGTGKLDWITKKIIEESGIFIPVPSTLREIAESSHY